MVSLVEQKEYEVETIEGGGRLLTIYDPSKTGVLAYQNFTIYYSDNSSESGSTDENGQYEVQKDLTGTDATIDTVEISGPTSDNPFLTDSSEDASPLDETEGSADNDDNTDEYEISDNISPQLENVQPSTAPSEGGTRIRISGSGFVDETTVKVGGKPATDLRIAQDGKAIYATLPESSAGDCDLIVEAPGQEPATMPKAISFVDDLQEAADASVSSYVIYLTEIRDLAKDLSNDNSLDDATKEQLSFETEFAGKVTHDVIESRAANAGEEAWNPEILDVWAKRQASLESLNKEIYDILGTGKATV